MAMALFSFFDDSSLMLRQANFSEKPGGNLTVFPSANFKAHASSEGAEQDDGDDGS